jgi:hypothetical protein
MRVIMKCRLKGTFSVETIGVRLLGGIFKFVWRGFVGDGGASNDCCEVLLGSNMGGLTKVV